MIRTHRRGGAQLVECYHDQIRQPLLRALTDERTIELHRRLADTMSLQREIDVEHVPRHYRAARYANYHHQQGVGYKYNHRYSHTTRYASKNHQGVVHAKPHAGAPRPPAAPSSP